MANEQVLFMLKPISDPEIRERYEQVLRERLAEAGLQIVENSEIHLQFTCN